MSVIF